MSQRTGAGLLAFGLMIALWVVAGFTPLPFVVYSPGPTVDILATSDGEEIVQVDGATAHHDEGELRLTTIYVTQPEDHVTLPELLRAYFSPSDAVYPRSAIYAPDETDESSDRISEVQMVSSQENAVAVALRELGHDVETKVAVLDVAEDMPAEGRLQAGDELLEVGTAEIGTPQDVVDAVRDVRAGEPLAFKVRRDGSERTVEVTPREVDGRPMVGITPGEAYDFPFEVEVDLDDNIGGPSAGLMMALAVYDTLTPGPLTGGGKVAGTGTISSDGVVGAIGGAQQKIVAARDTGVELFLVPAANCNSLGDVDSEDMRVARVATMTEALSAIEAWEQDPDTELASCEDEAS